MIDGRWPEVEMADDAGGVQELMTERAAESLEWATLGRGKEPQPLHFLIDI